MTESVPEAEQAPEKPGCFGRAVSRVPEVAGAVKDCLAGVGAQAWDTVKGVGQVQSAHIDCLVSGDCRQQAVMVTTLVTNPTTVVTATIDPVRNDWEAGNHARAAGRVALMLGEAIAARASANSARPPPPQPGSAANGADVPGSLFRGVAHGHPG